MKYMSSYSQGVKPITKPLRNVAYEIYVVLFPGREAPYEHVPKRILWNILYSIQGTQTPQQPFLKIVSWEI
jgi:hypothetical protein